MTDRLKRLHALYEGGLEEEFGDDTRLRQEMDDLRIMKDLLDARPKHRPRPGTVAAVLTAARTGLEDIEPKSVESERGQSADVNRGPRTDRPPRARRRAVVLRIGATSALVAVLLAVVGILQLNLLDPAVITSRSEAEESLAANEDGARTPENPPVADTPDAAPELAARESRAPASVAPQSAAPLADAASTATRPASPQEAIALRSAPQKTDRSTTGARDNAPSTATPFSERSQAQAQSLTKVYADSFAGSAAIIGQIARERAEGDVADYGDVLSWEQQGDVMEVYQHIELVSGDVSMEWESPAVPLEMIPENRAREPFLQEAGERRMP